MKSAALGADDAEAGDVRSSVCEFFIGFCAMVLHGNQNSFSIFLTALVCIGGPL
jgi:hypothetical protein